jgi:hypothetical protein
MFTSPVPHLSESGCKRFRIEILESRRLLAVTVSEGYPGFYEINGDDAPDYIDVAVSQQNYTFTLNGVTYTDVANIQVHGGGGDDVISVHSIDGPGDIGAGITGDDGNDVLSLNFDGGISGGNGDDTIILQDSFYGAAEGGAGNDSIYIQGGCVSADIHGDDGNDLIDGTASSVALTIHGGAGNDTLLGSDYADNLYGDGGSDSLVGNGGNDTFYTRGDTNDTVDGGDGYNIVFAGGGENISNCQQIYYG